jgi:hypothetical protein
MERKYRQRGYMDRDREEKPQRPPKPQGPPEFRSRPMPGFQEVFRCSLCGARVANPVIGFAAQCHKCKAELHSCKQCAYFDSGVRFECTQPITDRVPRKNAGNRCAFFEMKKSIERETSSSGTAKPIDARQAFDNLFKK